MSKKFILISAISVLGGALFISIVWAAFFTPLTIVNSGLAKSPSIKVDTNGIIHSFWSEINPSTWSSDVYYAKSGDNGVSFSASQNVSNTAVYSTNPTLTLDNNNALHLVYEEENLATGNFDIFYTRSNDGGASFIAPLNISQNITQSVSPDIKINYLTGNIYIAWVDETADAMQVFLARSVDGGANFNLLGNMSNTNYNTDNPRLYIHNAQENNHTHLIWNQEDPAPGIFYRKSSDGLNFTLPINVANNTLFTTYAPQISMSTSSHVHIAWAEFNANEPEIMYARSVDNGASFDLPKNLSNSLDAVSENPQIIFKQNKVYVFWTEDVCGIDGCTKRVYRSTSANNGDTFSNPNAPRPLQEFKAAQEIDFDVFNNDAYVLWQQLGNILFTKGN